MTVALCPLIFLWMIRSPDFGNSKRSLSSMVTGGYFINSSKSISISGMTIEITIRFGIVSACFIGLRDPSGILGSDNSFGSSFSNITNNSGDFSGFIGSWIFSGTGSIVFLGTMHSAAISWGSSGSLVYSAFDSSKDNGCVFSDSVVSVPVV